jgi:hypothetical protein
MEAAVIIGAALVAVGVVIFELARTHRRTTAWRRALRKMR